MPGSTLVTLISIEAAFLTHGALDLELASEEQLSPYNPKLRLLATETGSDEQALDVKATLVGTTKESKLISTFTFSLPVEAELVPGGHAIFDFSAQLDRSYQHMNDRNPQSLNDDYVRTFTISRVSPDRRQISITVKKAGVISSYLHSLAVRPGVDPVEIDLKGFGGTFTCFENGRAVPRMLWVAGGVGITPFLAMYRALRASGQPMPDIQLFYSCRSDEIELVREMTDIEVRVFDSKLSVDSPTVGGRVLHRRRLQASDFDARSDRSARDEPTRSIEKSRLDGATVFVCGPDTFMTDVRSWLEGRLEPARLRFESFDF
jgi:ferredoxin-NADP reductase